MSKELAECLLSAFDNICTLCERHEGENDFKDADELGNAHDLLYDAIVQLLQGGFTLVPTTDRKGDAE